MDKNKPIKEIREDGSVKGEFASSDIVPNAFVGFLVKTEDGKAELAKKEIVKAFNINKSLEIGRF